MKKFFALLLAAMMLCLCASAMAETAEVDAFTSASTLTWYPDHGLDGQELVDAINSYHGFYVVATTNPDNSANLAFVGMKAEMREDGVYVLLGMMENQTCLNLDRTRSGVAYFMNDNYSHDPEAQNWKAARMDLEVVSAVSSEMTWGGVTGTGWVIWCKVSVRSAG